MNAVFAFVRSLPKRAALLAIQFYRAAISPIFGPCACVVPRAQNTGSRRFDVSAYAREAGSP